MGCSTSKTQAAEPAVVANPLANEVNEEAAAAAAEKAAAVLAAVKAAAPEEVRLVLNDGLNDINGTAEHKRVSRVVAEWLVPAHAAAHGDPAMKCLARLVLGVYYFTMNMGWAGVFKKPYKEQLEQHLQGLGAELAEAYERQRLRASLGGYTMPEQPLIAAERARVEAAGGTYEFSSSMPAGVPPSEKWVFDGSAAVREHFERVYIQVLKLVAMALNKKYHKMMRDLLGVWVVEGKGLMVRGKDGRWRLTPPKGYARMDGKRVTDHVSASGCRPGLNVDVLRVLAVCATPEKLLAVMRALHKKFGGCGRVKVSRCFLVVGLARVSVFSRSRAHAAGAPPACAYRAASQPAPRRRPRASTCA